MRQPPRAAWATLEEISTSSTAQSTTTQFVESLRRGTGAQVFVAADGVPEGRPTLFNGAYTAEPLAVAACRTAEEVSRSLRIAEEYGVPVSVLAGGHDMAGRAICEGGLVIDLRPMSSVHVKTAAGEVTIGGGALMSGTAERLLAVKRRVDPTDVFRSSTGHFD